MKELLYILSFLALLFGIFVFDNTESAIHEIEGLISFLIFAVLFSGAAIFGAIEALKQTIESK